MLRGVLCSCAAAILLSVSSSFAQAPNDLSGTWVFTHANDQFQGTIVLRQEGNALSGIWHTSKGKSEPDDTLAGRVDGRTVTLARYIGYSLQTYTLTLSADGNRLDGFGDGYFLNHTNLNMQRVARAIPSRAATAQRKRSEPPPAADLSGTWVFTHANDQFQGTIVLRQQGNAISGIWHTSKGKSEPDDSIAARMDGRTVTLTRFIGYNLQTYALTLSADGNRLDGFGDGYFLNHTNLNMQRVAAAAVPPAATRKRNDQIYFPPPRGTWKWTIQSVTARRNGQIEYSSFYYEAATNRSVEQPLTLPAGAAIVGVFPDDCAFSMRDELGHSFTFQNEDEAKAQGLGPGTWSVYPLKCGGIDVFLR